LETKSMLKKAAGVIVGIVFVVMGFNQRSDIARIKSHGKVVAVKPIDGYTKRKSTYTAEFTFVTEEGRTITKKQSFPSELVKDFESNTPVDVVYNPADPSEFVFEKEKPEWFLIIAGVGLAVGALIFA
jgi:hypothetical protein